MHPINAFVTLTYDDLHMPENRSLDKSHFQKFMKRLRKNTGLKIRYYMCGEYGDTTDRPHYHALLFGCDFPDKVKHSGKGDKTLYKSEQLDKIWGMGFCTIGPVNYQTAGYVARYIMKKVNGDEAIKHYRRFQPETGEVYSIIPEYSDQSRRPGIGTEWFQNFKSDVYPSDFLVSSGSKQRVPRAYDKLLDKISPQLLQEIKDKRISDSKKRKSDSTPARLKVRETIKKSQLSQLKRTL